MTITSDRSNSILPLVGRVLLVYSNRIANARGQIASCLLLRDQRTHSKFGIINSGGR